VNLTCFSGFISAIALSHYRHLLPFLSQSTPSSDFKERIVVFSRLFPSACPSCRVFSSINCYFPSLHRAQALDFSRALHFSTCQFYSEGFAPFSLNLRFNHRQAHSLTSLKSVPFNPGARSPTLSQTRQHTRPNSFQCLDCVFPRGSVFLPFDSRVPNSGIVWGERRLPPLCCFFGEPQSPETIAYSAFLLFRFKASSFNGRFCAGRLLVFPLFSRARILYHGSSCPRLPFARPSDFFGVKLTWLLSSTCLTALWIFERLAFVRLPGICTYELAAL